MVKHSILTKREMKVIEKKLGNKRLTQLDSNILTRAVRPKLRAMSIINAQSLLQRIEYNRKSMPIEKKIKKIILNNVESVGAIILYGSVIQNNYNNYNDIDVLVITKNRVWDKLWQKYKKIEEVREIAKAMGLNLDLQIIDKNLFYYQCSSNPSLIYQLKDSRTIYGKVRNQSKVEISKMNLRMKLDWSYVDNRVKDSNEIYQAIRNTLLVRLLLNKIVDNGMLYQELINTLGINLLTRLKMNKASKLERKLALEYLSDLNKKTEKEVLEAKWEKIVL